MAVLDSYLQEDAAPQEATPSVLDSYLEGADDNTRPELKYSDKYGNPDPLVVKTTKKIANTYTDKKEIGKSLARQAGLTGRYLVEGAAGLPATIADYTTKPAMNMAVKGYNYLTGSNVPEFPEQNQAISNQLTKYGVPEPQGATERVVGDISRGMTGAATSVGAGNLLTQASSPLIAKIGQIMQSNPGLQIASGGTGSGSAGTAREMGYGPVGQTVAGVVGSTVPFGIDMYLQNRAGNLGKPSSSAEPYMDKLHEALKRDNISPDEVPGRLAELGPNATIADLGENTKGVARAIAGIPGEGKEQITNFLEERQAGRPDRVMQAVTEGLGIEPGATSDQTIQGLIEKRADNAAPLYKQAFAANQNVVDPKIDRILSTPAGQKALKAAAIKMQNDMTLMGVPDAELAEQAKLADTYQPGGISSGLKLRTLDYVKRSFDDQIGAAIRSGETDNVRVLTGLKNRFIGAVDAADVTAKTGPNSFAPEGGLYKQARAAFSEPSQSIEAVEAGKNFIKNGATSNLSVLKDMSDADKQFFRIGVGQQISDMLDNTSEGRDVVKAIFGKPKVQKALQSAFPDPEAYDNFVNTIKKESVFANTEKAILQGSRTTPMAQEIENLGQAPSKPVQIAKTVGTHAYELGTRNTAGKAIYIGKGIVNRLTQPTPLEPEQMGKLTNALLASPEVSEQFVLPPQGGQNLLSRYMNHLVENSGLQP